jgi:sugar lactone lactonase YvrE
LRRSGFKPKGIATDSLGDILVADLDNACVHIIDENGKFLKIIDCPNVKPWGLCMSLDDYLYVADNEADDVIKIQYLQ